MRFLRPTPLGPALTLRAAAVEVSDSKIVVNAEAWVDEKPRASMLATWLRFHPR